MKITLLQKHVSIIRKEVPFFLESVQAGFPSPAEDYVEQRLDINDLLQVDETSTFFVRAEGNSMVNSGIMPGDILCVRKDFEPVNGQIVIAAIDNEFTVKRYHKIAKKLILQAANDDYPDIEPEDEQEVQIWGVVTGIARVFK